MIFGDIYFSCYKKQVNYRDFTSLFNFDADIYYIVGFC